MNGLCKADKYNETYCKVPKCDQIAKVDGDHFVTYNDESALQMAVLSTPVCASFDGSQPSFEHYKSGIYSDLNCSRISLDHSLLVVGYGTDSSGNDYWICKNSWGVDWGMKGYVNVARNKGNMCGIASNSHYPV